MQMMLGDRLWNGEGKEIVTYFVYCFEKKKSEFNHHVLKISYTDWVIIDVLFQSLLESCKNLSSNFNSYWLNLEYTVFCSTISVWYSENIFLIIPPQTVYYLRNSMWLAHSRLLFELLFCTVIGYREMGLLLTFMLLCGCIIWIFLH